MEKHALVIGGTGMLKQVTLWLERNGYHVSVIGRKYSRLNAVVKEAGDAHRVTPISLDYYDDGALRSAIEKTNAEHGPIDLVVAWIHSAASNALSVLNETVSKNAIADWRLLHVRGSTAYIDKKNPEVPANCLYRQVLLGFVLDGGGARWLTHGEIASGVIKAIHTDEEEHVVGTLEPWDQRP